MSLNSPKLNNSFEEYRKTSAYKEEVTNRTRVLKEFWFAPEFIKALARFSVNTWLKISELLDPENMDLIAMENKELEKQFDILDKKQDTKAKVAIFSTIP